MKRILLIALALTACTSQPPAQRNEQEEALKLTFWILNLPVGPRLHLSSAL